MARRGSVIASAERAARAAARAQRQAETVTRQRRHLSRFEQAQALTADVEQKVASLHEILKRRGTLTSRQLFTSLRLQDPPPVLMIPPDLERSQSLPQRSAYVGWVRHPAWWEKLLQVKRYERELHAAEARFSAEIAKWQESENARLARIEGIKSQHARVWAAYEEKVAERDREIQALRERYQSAEADGIVTFYEVLLGRSAWPEDFPQDVRIAYEPGPKQLVVDYELPTSTIIPAVTEYRYVKTRDAIESKARKPAEVKELYRDLIAAIALRCLHECFAADGEEHIDVITFSGYVNTLDPATGNPIRPYLISARVTKERFGGIVLDRIDTKACLRNLGAQVSPQPAELLPVKPIIEFDMVDKRFIGERDVLSELDGRPNLMDLTPAEFEALVGNLFTRMGLETKLTRTSRDGGVDAVAFDIRPILGGKVVIQAKRYSHTVGVSAVRDLYGTMMNEGANKGILVTTSSYGPDAYDFCKDKPVELIDGAGLLYHLEQVGVPARIIFPDDQAVAGFRNSSAPL